MGIVVVAWPTILFYLLRRLLCKVVVWKKKEGRVVVWRCQAKTRSGVRVCVSRARAFDTVTLTQGKEREGKKWVKKQRDFFFFENFVSIIKP